MSFLKCLKASLVKILKLTEGTTRYYPVSTNAQASIQDGVNYIQFNVASGGLGYVSSVDVTGYTKLCIKASTVNYEGSTIRLLNNNVTSGAIHRNTPTDVEISLTGLTGIITLQLGFTVGGEAYRIYEMYLTNE